MDEIGRSHTECNKEVSHGGCSMIFSTPNSLTRYRAESFSTKEPETLQWIDEMPSDSVLWDIGANVGIYSIYAAKRHGISVMAFEPSVFNLELLARNIFLNNLANDITMFPVALSDEAGPSIFRMSSTALGGALSTFGQDFDQKGNKFNTRFNYHTMGVTMDDILRVWKISAPRFIKIDVDGIEHFILRGGGETLKGVQSVMIEIDDDFSDQAEESARYLREAGLTLLRKCGGGGAQFNQWWTRMGS